MNLVPKSWIYMFNEALLGGGGGSVISYSFNSGHSYP